MNHYATISAALDVYGIDPDKRREALSALAELEKAASVPAKYLLHIDGNETDRTISPPVNNEHMPPGASWKPLYAAPPIPPAIAAATPVPAVEVSDEMCERAFEQYALSPARISRAEIGRDLIAAVQAELGPALGLSVWREPTDAECRLMESLLARMNLRLDTSYGRDIFDCVHEVMGGGK